MSRHERILPAWSFKWAMAISLALHGGVLFLVRTSPPAGGGSPPRIEATLGPRVPVASAMPEEAPPALAPTAPAESSKPAPRRLAVEKPATSARSPAQRQWSRAEKDEMNRFLGDLAGPAPARPDLARRALAMAGELGRQEAYRDEEETVSLERPPGGPPVDPFSLEMYLDGMVKKLNRSAAFVRNDPRSRGVRTAAVQIRLNPNGSLQSFKVLNAGDQQDQIAFIKSVVEQAVPFSPFPGDMRKSAQSLAMVICILPAGSGGGFGFTRNTGGRGC